MFLSRYYGHVILFNVIRSHDIFIHDYFNVHYDLGFIYHCNRKLNLDQLYELQDALAGLPKTHSVDKHTTRCMRHENKCKNWGYGTVCRATLYVVR